MQGQEHACPGATGLSVVVDVDGSWVQSGCPALPGSRETQEGDWLSLISSSLVCE